MSGPRSANGTARPGCGRSSLPLGSCGRADGSDGKGWEYVFVRTTEPSPPANIVSTAEGRKTDDYIPASPTGITDDPQGIDVDHPHEWAAVRKYDVATKTWSEFRPWFRWLTYVPPGRDGAGNETIYFQMERDIPPPRPQTTELQDDVDDYVPDGWTDEPRGASPQMRFEWGSQRKTAPAGSARKWAKFSPPYLANHYAEDGVQGTDGIGVNSIVRDPETGLVTVAYDVVDWMCLVEDTGSLETTYRHESLSSGTRAYRVRARNDEGVGPPSNSDIAVTRGQFNLAIRWESPASTLAVAVRKIAAE